MIVYLASGGEEGCDWRLSLTCSSGTKNFMGNYVLVVANEKKRLRTSDRTWVYRNIPSSIHWYTEIHHDWSDGGRMYLLSHGEHLVLTRRERNNNVTN